MCDYIFMDSKKEQKQYTGRISSTTASPVFESRISSSTKGREPIKVKYIDSPVMVNAKNATEFRTIVQQLTGKSPASSSVKEPLSQEIDNNNVDYELFWEELSEGIFDSGTFGSSGGCWSRLQA
uniref:VQ domain-containing protein n=2 Tax=Nicotiana TaxID=4085 RepID=A0A1S3XPP3_TOBAC|nr:PREDICTED: uncharacterized protein LOC104222399 [Nicotiana sylvestris]XP_016441908.1 PREDICTED: uncharacterized protein LOC107767412 [Nicotiana tabacum]